MSESAAAKMTPEEKIKKLIEENGRFQADALEASKHIEILEGEIDKLGQTMRLFADPANWKNDRWWSPVLIGTNEFPDMLAQRALDAQQAEE